MRRVLLMLLVAGAACRGGGARSGETVRLVAAASLRDALVEIEAAFERERPGVDVEVVFAASGAAVEQLAHGAPFDVFLSADGKHADEVVRRGLAVPGSRRVYARGRLALWLPSRVGVVPHDFSALEDPRVRRVAIASPETAPYGRAAREALERAGLWERIRGKLVFGQDVAQAAQQAQVGADAGLLALSLVLSPTLRESGAYWPVPVALHGPLDQVLVSLRDTPASRSFVGFLLGEEARGILVRYGYEGGGGERALRRAQGGPVAGGGSPSTPRHGSGQAGSGRAGGGGGALGGALLLTLELALWTSALVLLLGAPLAWVLARRRFFGRRVLETIVFLPLVLPPTVLGFYLLVLLGEGGPLARWLDVHWAFRFEGIVVGSVLFNLPFALTSYREAFRALDEDLLQTARTLGASRLRVMREVVLPLSWPGLAAGTLLAFAHTLGEFGVVLMIGGSVPDETRVVSIHLFELTQALRMGEAHEAALVLVGVSFVLLFAIRTLEVRWTSGTGSSGRSRSRSS